MSQTYNHDIASIVRKVRRFKTEAHKMVSAGLSELTEHDVTRLLSYSGNIRAHKAWVMSEPSLDLPESHPTIYELGDGEALAPIENEDAQVLLDLLSLIETELVNSQSSRRAGGLTSFDSARYDALVDKFDNFLNNYVSAANPVDLPESMPRQPLSGPGAKGV